MDMMLVVLIVLPKHHVRVILMSPVDVVLYHFVRLFVFLRIIVVAIRIVIV